jgi:hypothetical protein
MSDKDLISTHLANMGYKVQKCRPAFAQGCEIPTHERKLIRRDRKAGVTS